MNKRIYKHGFLQPKIWKDAGNPSKRRMLDLHREINMSSERVLYHYTSLSGFKGIVDSRGFWASDNRYLNDAHETSNGRELAVKVLDYKIKRTSLVPFRRVLEVVRSAMRESPQTGQLVVCFSKARDSLEQWRGYGEDVGVCIRVDQHHQETIGYRSLFYGPQQMPFDVQYDERRKVIALLSVIRRFADEYSTDRQIMNDYWPDEHDEQYAQHLIGQLEYHTAVFKDKSFAAEKEVRLSIPHSYEENYEGGLQFRVSKFGLIPYICTGDDKGGDGLLPIDEVIIGPSQNKYLVAESVASFMKHRGYENVSIALSQVPYRS